MSGGGAQAQNTSLNSLQQQHLNDMLGAGSKKMTDQGREEHWRAPPLLGQVLALNLRCTSTSQSIRMALIFSLMSGCRGRAEHTEAFYATGLQVQCVYKEKPT